MEKREANLEWMLLDAISCRGRVQTLQLGRPSASVELRHRSDIPAFSEVCFFIPLHKVCLRFGSSKQAFYFVWIRYK